MIKKISGALIVFASVSTLLSGCKYPIYKRAIVNHDFLSHNIQVHKTTKGYTTTHNRYVGYLDFKKRILEPPYDKLAKNGVFVFPRDTTFPLGTVFHATNDNQFQVFYDSSVSELMDNRVSKSEKREMILKASLLESTFNMLVSPERKEQIKYALREGDHVSYSNVSARLFSAEIHSIDKRSNYMDEISRKVRMSPNFRPEGYYFVADTIIKARDMAYFVEGSSLYKTSPAEDSKAHIKYHNGVKTLHHPMKTQKVVAVSFAILPKLTRKGSKMARVQQPVAAEKFYLSARPARIIAKKCGISDTAVRDAITPQSYNRRPCLAAPSRHRGNAISGTHRRNPVTGTYTKFN